MPLILFLFLTKQRCTRNALFLHKQSVIHIIFLIQIILPFAKVDSNISAAVQALCAPRNDCGMDGRSRLLRLETGSYYRYTGGKPITAGEKPITTGGKPITTGGFSIRTLLFIFHRPFVGTDGSFMSFHGFLCDSMPRPLFGSRNFLLYNHTGLFVSYFQKILSVYLIYNEPKSP